MGGGSTANQDDSSVLSYISYLKRYVFVLETYLEKGSEERYLPNQDKCLVSPMTYVSKAKIANEIINISNIIASYEKFRKSNTTDGDSVSTEPNTRSVKSTKSSVSKVRKPNRSK
jgi:hypothetical protein